MFNFKVQRRTSITTVDLEHNVSLDCIIAMIDTRCVDIMELRINFVNVFFSCARLCVLL